MPTQTPVLSLGKFRRYVDAGGREFYLSKGVVTEDGQSINPTSRWDADYVLRQVERQKGVPQGTLALPTLYELHTVVKQDSEVRQSISNTPILSEWVRTLILNPNAPTETRKYVLMDADKNQAVLQHSNTPRSLNPVKMYKEGRRNIVVANVFDVPFDLKDGQYNLEMLDPETGFLKQAPKSKGPYKIWFNSNKMLCASVLNWSFDFSDDVQVLDWSFDLEGDVHFNCGGPSSSHDDVGLRVSSIENLPESLVESEGEFLEFIVRAEIENLQQAVIGKNYPASLKRAERVAENLRKLLANK